MTQVLFPLCRTTGCLCCSVAAIPNVGLDIGQTKGSKASVLPLYMGSAGRNKGGGYVYEDIWKRVDGNLVTLPCNRRWRCYQHAIYELEKNRNPVHRLLELPRVGRWNMRGAMCKCVDPV